MLKQCEQFSFVFINTVGITTCVAYLISGGKKSRTQAQDDPASDHHHCGKGLLPV